LMFGFSSPILSRYPRVDLFKSEYVDKRCPRTLPRVRDASANERPKNFELNLVFPTQVLRVHRGSVS
jgi:hypothetical protein